jgi:DNA-binding FadR family transcriptional regulator
MPTQRELANHLGTKGKTVHNAYQRLIAEDLLTAKGSQGTRVASRQAPRASQATEVPQATRSEAGHLAPPDDWLERLRDALEERRGTTDRPDRLRLAEVLRTHIDGTILPPHTHLPTMEELAQHLKIKELIVYDAYQHLADTRLLTISPDEGVRVAGPPAWLPTLRDELNWLKNWLRISGTLDSLSEQLAKALRTCIHQGILQPGELLPRMKDLASDLNVSWPTVQEACWQLRDEGLLIIKKGWKGGQGTRVAPREEWKTGDPAAASQAPQAVQTAQPEPQPSSGAAIPGGPQALDTRQAPEPGGEVPGDARETGRTTGPEGTADAVPPQHKRKGTHPATAPGESQTGKKARSTVAQPSHQPSVPMYKLIVARASACSGRETRSLD